MEDIMTIFEIAGRMARRRRRPRPRRATSSVKRVARCGMCGNVTHTYSSEDQVFCRYYANAYPNIRLELVRVNGNWKRTMHSSLTIREWFQALDDWGWRCAYCGRPFQVLEHHVPVPKGGSTTR
jgi:hypothetical protein